MFNISLYLERFKVIKNPQIFKREIIDALNKITGHVLTDKEVSLRKGIITVESNSIIRSEIFQKKVELVEKLSAFYVSDIR